RRCDCPCGRRCEIMNRRLIVTLITTSILTGCMVGPKYQRPGMQTPTVYRVIENPTTPPNPQTLADTKWFDVFNDSALQELIRQALVGNYDLREAVARFEQAQANYGIFRSDQFPKFEAGANITFQGLSRDGQFSVQEPIKRTRTFGGILLGLLTFEVDVWGRLRSASGSAT